MESFVRRARSKVWVDLGLTMDPYDKKKLLDFNGAKTFFQIISAK